MLPRVHSAGVLVLVLLVSFTVAPLDPDETARASLFSGPTSEARPAVIAMLFALVQG
jgi:hypothetical protein